MPSVQAVVYEEFARNIPGFKHLTENEAATIAPKVRAFCWRIQVVIFS